jgi:signal transduction histidine kinase
VSGIDVAPLRGQGLVAGVRASLPRSPLLADTALAIGLTVVSVATLAAGAGDLGAVSGATIVFLLLQTLPLALRRVAPVPVFLVTFGALLAHAAVAIGTLSAPIGSLIALFTVADRIDRRRSGLLALAAGASIAVLIAARVGLQAGLSGTIQTELSIAAAWLLGTWSKDRRAYVEALHERAILLEREREERAARAVAEERDRIARELHDVVTHHVSVIVIQAGAGLRSLDKRPEDSRNALQAIDATGRQALADMRRMLGILGSPDAPSPAAAAVAGTVPLADTPNAPMPRLDRLGELLEQVRGAGMPVELSVTGDPRPLDPGVELSAYRIVQEALTNTLKHARGAAALVELAYGMAELRVTVTDRGGHGARGLGVSGEPGRGLIGMRERAAMFGGGFEAGPTADGFRVSAALPLPSTAV